MAQRGALRARSAAALSALDPAKVLTALPRTRRPRTGFGCAAHDRSDQLDVDTRAHLAVLSAMTNRLERLAPRGLVERALDSPVATLDGILAPAVAPAVALLSSRERTTLVRLLARLDQTAG